MVSQHITSVRSFFMMYNIALEGHFADMLLKFTVSHFNQRNAES